MQPDFAARLTNALSSERLAAYQDRLNRQGNLNLFSHYAWNMALSESLYPSLQVLEVTLRNAIHNAVSQRFKRSDWYEDTTVIKARDAVFVTKAEESLRKAHKPCEPGRLVAELNLGFWIALFDSRYEQVLWPQLLKPCFPAMPRALRTRKNILARLEKIRRLRNRVFHHEPIWYWQDLAQQHADMLEAIGWIEPAAKQLVETVDNFPSVYGHGLAEIENRLRQFC
jgi:hypothetical protein